MCILLTYDIHSNKIVMYTIVKLDLVFEGSMNMIKGIVNGQKLK